MIISLGLIIGIIIFLVGVLFAKKINRIMSRGTFRMKVKQKSLFFISKLRQSL